MCGQHFRSIGSESIAAANRPNLIKELVIDRPNQVWTVRRAVSDITYWFTHYGCLYISLVTDAYSKRIMGYGVAPTLHAVHCKAALQMALEQIDLRTGQSLIHHRSGGFNIAVSSM